MVTEALIGWFVQGIATLIGWLPDLPVALQQGMATAQSAVQSVADAVAPWGFVVPFSQIAVALGIWLAGFVVAGLVRVVRIVASFATLGGGM